MRWIAHYYDPKLNANALTRPCATKEGALRLACDLMRRQRRVEFIEGPESLRIHAVEIAEWAHPITDRRPRLGESRDRKL